MEEYAKIIDSQLGTFTNQLIKTKQLVIGIW